MAKQQTKCITSIGGQALIEGIMMRGPQKTVVASRLPDKTIDTEDMNIVPLKNKCENFRMAFDPRHYWLGGILDDRL